MRHRFGRFRNEIGHCRRDDNNPIRIADNDIPG